jgi:hypothetical protein
VEGRLWRVPSWSRVGCDGNGKEGRKSGKVHHKRKVGIMKVGYPVASGQRKVIKLHVHNGVK